LHYSLIIFFGGVYTFCLFPISLTHSRFLPFYRKIRRYLKEKTGIVYELHIIAEAGANGSILSLESDMTLHDRCDADTHELHLPMACNAL
jgi:hypothetical protein